MNPYEITLIVRPDLDDEGIRSATEAVTDRIESAPGEIIASYSWTPFRRRMTYPIRNFGEGHYFTCTFRFEPQAVGEFENSLKLNENVLRYLIVQATDQAVKQSQQRMQQIANAAAAPPPTPPRPEAAPASVPDTPVQSPEIAPPAPAPATPAQESETSPVEPPPATPQPETESEPVVAETLAQTEGEATPQDVELAAEEPVVTAAAPSGSNQREE